jgi:hypothetical protein
VQGESHQWLIIHGRLPGNAFAPFAPTTAVLFFPPPLQQLQPAPCFAELRGSLALRSLTACAWRTVAGMPVKAGAVASTRGASLPHAGHAAGSRHCAMGRMAVKPPHSMHSYS